MPGSRSRSHRGDETAQPEATLARWAKQGGGGTKDRRPEEPTPRHPIVSRSQSRSIHRGTGILAATPRDSQSDRHFRLRGTGTHRVTGNLGRPWQFVSCWGGVGNCLASAGVAGAAVISALRNTMRAGGFWATPRDSQSDRHFKLRGTGTHRVTGNLGRPWQFVSCWGGVGNCLASTGVAGAAVISALENTMRAGGFWATPRDSQSDRHFRLRGMRTHRVTGNSGRPWQFVTCWGGVR
jgi:hypothetical protein